jgi:hypothetical protein
VIGAKEIEEIVSSIKPMSYNIGYDIERGIKLAIAKITEKSSDGFTAWIKTMDFHCQYKAEGHLISLEAYLDYVAEVAWQAAKLSAFRDVNFTNEQYLKLEEESKLLQSWVKHHQKSVELCKEREAELEAENKGLREMLSKMG